MRGLKAMKRKTWTERLLAWYRASHRDLPWRRTGDIYAVWVSEVMLQQTRVETVIPYYERFLARFPTAASLAAAPLQDVLKLWEGLGYYGRARHFHRAAQRVVAEHGGRVPTDYEAFRALPGVGDYIAAAVLSIAAGAPHAVVDGNVLRVWARFRGIGEEVRAAKVVRRIREELRAAIPADEPGDFNQALMELGATVCTPSSPRCPLCPLAAECTAFHEGRTAELPVRSVRPAVPHHRIAVAVIRRRDGRLLIQQRPPEGLLGGLWEFPGGKIEPGETPEEAVRRECREETGLDVAVEAELAEVRHAYSHFSVTLHVFACRASGRTRAGRPRRWVRAAELDDLPFPAANKKFFARLREFLPGEPGAGNN
jgi:A/G-specific adenine glycosylase